MANSDIPRYVSLTDYQRPPAEPEQPQLVAVVAEMRDLLVEVRDLLSDGRTRPKPRRTNHSEPRERAREWLTKKLREAEPLGVEWKRLKVERGWEGQTDRFSESTMERVRSEVGFARYADGTCYWKLRPEFADPEPEPELRPAPPLPASQPYPETGPAPYPVPPKGR